MEISCVPRGADVAAVGKQCEIKEAPPAARYSTCREQKMLVRLGVLLPGWSFNRVVIEAGVDCCRESRWAGGSEEGSFVSCFDKDGGFFVGFTF